MKELKITKGDWLFEIEESRVVFENPNMDLWFKNFNNGFDSTKEEVLSNAKLIADAGTTANKCGLLPSELLEQRDDILKELDKINKLCVFNVLFSKGKDKENYTKISDMIFFLKQKIK